MHTTYPTTLLFTRVAHELRKPQNLRYLFFCSQNLSPTYLLYLPSKKHEGGGLPPIGRPRGPHHVQNQLCWMESSCRFSDLILYF